MKWPMATQVRVYTTATHICLQHNSPRPPLPLSTMKHSSSHWEVFFASVQCFKKDRLKLISQSHFSEGTPSFSPWVTCGVGAVEFITAHLSWLSLCSVSPQPTGTRFVCLTDQHTQTTANLKSSFLFTFPGSNMGFLCCRKQSLLAGGHCFKQPTPLSPSAVVLFHKRIFWLCPVFFLTVSASLGSPLPPPFRQRAT